MAWKRCLLSITIAILLASASGADEPENEPLKLDLGEVISRALEVSPTLDDFRSRVREADYQVEEAYTRVSPTIDFSAQYSRVEPPISLPGGIIINPADNYQFSLTIRQAIYTFGRLRWSSLTSKLNKLSAQENYRNEIDKLIEEVATLYFQAVLADQQVTILEKTLQSQLANLRQSELLYEQGVAAKFDVLRNRSEVSRARQSLRTAENNARIAKVRVLAALAKSFDSPLELRPTPLADPPETDLEKARQVALTDRPELNSLRYAIESAEARVHATWAENNPSLDLQNQTLNRNATGFAPGTQNTTALILSFPLFDGGLTRTRARQAEEAVTQLRNSLEQTRRSVLVEVEDAYRGLNTSWENIDVAQQGVLESEEAFRVAQLRYKNGVSTNVELLETQSALAQSRFSLAEALSNYQVARWRYWRSVSGEYPVDVPLPEEYRAPLPEQETPLPYALPLP